MSPRSHDGKLAITFPKKRAPGLDSLELQFSITAINRGARFQLQKSRRHRIILHATRSIFTAITTHTNQFTAC